MDDYGSALGSGGGGGGSKEFGRSEAHAISGGYVNFGDGAQGGVNLITLLALAGVAALSLMLFLAFTARR